MRLTIEKLILLSKNCIIYITISTFTSVRPYGVGGGGGVGGGVPLSIFKFLQSYDKVSLIKVA